MSAELPVVPGGFKTIVADPAWPYDQKLGRADQGDKTRGGLPYEPMTLAEIRALRVAALKKVAGGADPSCLWCSVGDVRILEIDHVEGGGTRETNRGNRSKKFYLEIIAGRQSTNDLRILCRPDNVLAYIIKKYPDMAGHLKVVWTA